MEDLFEAWLALISLDKAKLYWKAVSDHCTSTLSVSTTTYDATE